MVEEQDDAERGDHLIEVVTVIEVAENKEFEQQAERQSRKQGQDERSQKVAGDPVERHGEVGPEHVLDAVGQIDEIHDAEHQRQAGGDQE